MVLSGDERKTIWLQIWTAGFISLGATVLSFGAAMWLSILTLLPVLFNDKTDSLTFSIMKFFNYLSPIFVIIGSILIAVGFIVPFITLRKMSK